MKVLVIATGWHYSSHFYREMIKQEVPDGWSVDYYSVAHRSPDDENAIVEKENVRNHSNLDSFWEELDLLMYETPITKKEIQELGWGYSEEENTVGDMECFNQWADKNDYTQYDSILITHDDNLILSDQLFVDMDKKINVLKPNSDRYGSANHQVNTTQISLDDDWYFLDNGYTENISKALTPRGSFCFYKKELIDLLPNNRFNMYEEGGLGIVNRVGKTNSVGYGGITAWNAHAGTFRDFLYENNLVPKIRWFSDVKRVSKYCIEGERGFVTGNRANEPGYEKAVQNILTKIGWI